MKRLLRISKLLFSPLAIVFLLYILWIARDQLQAMFAEATPLWFALSVAAWCIFNITTPLLAVIVLRACGSDVNWRTAMATHARRLPGRYLPGGIWHTVGRVLDYSESGVSPRHLTTFVTLENGLAVTLALAFGGAIVFTMHGGDPTGIVAAIASIAAVIALPLIWIAVNRRVLVAPDRLTASAFVTSVALMSTVWLFAIVSFLCYIEAIPSAVPGLTSIELSGVYLFSWGAGFLAVFAPQGIGVFELVSAALLKGTQGFVELAALMSAFRLVILVADIIVWAAYHLLKRANPQ